MKRKAFTLTEMLITFLIITTLFVLVAAYVDFSGEEKREATANVELMEIRKAFIDVAAKESGFSVSLATLASQVNVALQNDMSFAVAGGNARLDSAGNDPWGTKYRVVLNFPPQTNGQIKIACAGADKAFDTSDDIVSYVRYATVSDTGNISVSVDGIAFESLGSGVVRDDLISQNHPTWGNNTRTYLKDLSWDEIANMVALSSYAGDLFYLGDSKRYNFGSDIDGDGVSDYVVLTIVGFGCDELSDGSGVGEVTFLATESSIKYSGTRNTTTGGWASQEINEYLNTTVYNKFSSKMKNAIRSVVKNADTGNPKYLPQEVSSRLWLPSVTELTCKPLEYEINGETIYTTMEQGEMYELYKRGDKHYFSNGTGICHAPTRTSIKGTQFFAGICSAGEDMGHSSYIQSDEMTLFFGITLGKAP